MRRLVLVVLAAGMIWIPSSAHATTCIWSLPGPGYRSPYDAVFVGTILENKNPHWPLLRIHSIEQGWKLRALSTVTLHIDTPWTPTLEEDSRYLITANAKWSHTGHKFFAGECSTVEKLKEPTIELAKRAHSLYPRGR